KIVSFNQKFVGMWRIPDSIIASRDDNQALAFVLDQLKDPEGFLKKVRELYTQPEAESYDILGFKDGRIFERYSQPQWLSGKTVGRVWSFRDITERKQAEEALLESEDRYRRLVEISPDAIAVHCEGKIAFVNSAAVRLLGATRPDDLIGKSALEIVHPDDREMAKQRIAEMLRGGKSVPTAEERFLRIDGSVIDVEVAAVATTHQNKPAVQVVVRDMTVHKKLEQQIKEAKNYLESIITTTADAIITTDLEGRVVSWNPGAEKLYGWHAEEVIGKHIPWVPEELMQEAEEVLARVGKEEHFVNYETKRRRKDGTVIDIGTTVSPLRNADGKIIGVTGIARDITERKQAEEALRESEERFTAFMNNSPIVAWLKDPATWTYRYINNAFEEVFDITREVISTKTDFDLWPEEIARQLRENDLRVVSSDKTIQTSEDVPLPDGTVHHWLVFKFPLRTPSGKRFLAGTAIDITASKRAEKALRESELRFRSVWEKSIDGMRITNEEGIVVLVNDAYCKMIEKPREEIEGKPISIVYEEAKQAEVLRKHQERFRSRSIHSYLERELVLWNGKRISLELSNSFIEIPDWPTVSLSVLRDITERKRMEAENYRLSLVARQTSNMVLITDEQQRIVWANDAFARITEYTIEEAIGRNPGILLQSENTDPQTIDQVRDALDHGREIRCELLNRSKSGREYWIEAYIQPLHPEQGSFAGFIAIENDVTERKKAEVEREKLLSELQEALANIKTLGGLIPICSNCKKIRDDRGYWNQIEKYIMEHSDALFSHGICPDCARELYPKYFDKPDKGKEPGDS
ncbi:MAG: PAS domain S-box protein, partial [Ignavibacteriales bacterium]|nr:PAS domain S-box protein [Ignavibacteriales bacterium]